MWRYLVGWESSSQKLVWDYSARHHAKPELKMVPDEELFESHEHTNM